MTIYLHYLDRELRESVGAVMSEHLLHNVTAVIGLSTCDTLYCALSLICETCYPDRGLSELTSNLIRLQHLLPLSNYPTLSEFIESRQVLYGHDASRYPMYFDPKQKEELLADDFAIVSKQADTTEDLRRALSLHSGEDSGTATTTQRNSEVDNTVREIISKGLGALRDKAVTYAAFHPLVTGKPEIVGGSVRRLISQGYSRHYQASLKGNIVTGVPRIECYDILSTSFPRTDYPLLRNLMRSLWVNFEDVLSRPKWVANLLMLRGGESHHRFCDECEIYLKTLAMLYGPMRGPDWILRVREAVLTDLRQSGPRRTTMVDGEDPFWAAFAGLRDHMDSRGRRDGRFLEICSMAREVKQSGEVKVLLCTATDLEDDVLASIAESGGNVLEPRSGKRGVYVSLGSIGWSEVVWVRSRMGTTGSSAAELTTLDAIDDVRPAHVISCGIGFGRSPDEQSLGDIMVSEWVRLYDKQRRGAKKIIPRGDRIPASSVLLQIASALRLMRPGSKVHTGGILSGDKLVDDPDFKEELWEIEPEAIGGDMEGAGVVSACTRRNIPWILVKGICDWGESKGNKKQKLAARHAIRFVFDMLVKVNVGP